MTMRRASGDQWEALTMTAFNEGMGVWVVIGGRAGCPRGVDAARVSGRETDRAFNEGMAE